MAEVHEKEVLNVVDLGRQEASKDVEANHSEDLGVRHGTADENEVAFEAGE